MFDNQNISKNINLFSDSNPNEYVHINNIKSIIKYCFIR